MKRVSEWGKWQAKTITPALVQELAGYVREGATLKIAAKRAGVPPGILNRWYTAGREQVEGLYDAERGHPDQVGMLYDALFQAEGERDMLYVSNVRQAVGPGSEWRARSWLLERHDPEDFGDRSSVEISGPQGGPIMHEGRAIAGFVDLVAFARSIGAGHLLGLDPGDPQRAVPSAADVLPDPALAQPAAVGSADLHGP